MYGAVKIYPRRFRGALRGLLWGEIIMRETFRSLRKRDYAVLGVITVLLLIAIYAMTGTTKLYGSIIDWVSQHSVLPEYYRQTFYETGELFPEFAFQLGGGQNAYYFGYYGFLNPVYLGSYPFPGISMVTYLQFASVVMLIASVWLFFLWIRHITIAFGRSAVSSDGAVYAATALFSFATPLLFHSHRQVMFVDYMPFLLLALIGVDRFFARRRRGLLAVSVALLFFTSYFYAVPGVCVVTLYGIYRCISCMKEFTFRKFLQSAWRFALCMLTGVVIASILTIPSLMVIFSGREPGTRPKMEIEHMLLGDMDFAGAICYSGYSMGMTAIAYLALCVMAVPKRKKRQAGLSENESAAGDRAPSVTEISAAADRVPVADRVSASSGGSAEAVLAIGVLACAWLPWVRYLLNGFLYAREKILIPFIPIAAYLVGVMLQQLRTGKIPLRRFTVIAAAGAVLGMIGYLFCGEYKLIALFAADAAGTIALTHVAVRKRNLLPLTIPVFVLAMVISLVYSHNQEKPVTREYAEKLYDAERERVIEEVLSRDDGVYRSADFVEVKYGVNRLRGKRYLSTGMYSSLSNMSYLKLMYGDLGAANPTVNDISFTPQNDIFLQTLMGVRYVVTETDAPAGYTPVDGSADGKVRVYTNPDAYTTVFAAKQRMSLREFRSLSPADREIALLFYAVTEEDGPDVYRSPLEDTGITVDFGREKDANGNIRVASDSVEQEYTVPIPDFLDEYVYVVTTTVAERHFHRTIIDVNGITGILSGRNNSRPNENFNMKFVVSSSEPNRELRFRFKGEDVVISPPRIQRVKLSDVKAARNNMTMASELENPRNNRITGRIAPDAAGVLVTSIPYDEAWTVRVDGKETPIFRVDDGFLGCEIAAGEHTFEMVYHAPGRIAGMVLSLVGLIGLALLIIVPRLRDKKHKGKMMTE